MKLEPTSLNIPFESSRRIWKEPSILIGTAVLSLLVTWSSSWLAGVIAVALGVPLFCAMLLLIRPLTSRAPPVLKFVVLFGIYLPTSWVLGVVTEWLTNLASVS